MSEDMRGRSWRALAASAASSRLATFKGQVQGYLAQQDIKNSTPSAAQRQLGSGERSGTGNRQTWRQWAGQKLGRGNTSGTEKIALFPGWASKRPRNAGNEHDEEFEVDIFVSGFATVHRGQEVASRSQRTFIRLAKGFAALPKLTGDVEDSRDNDQPDLMSTQLTPSTEELLKSVNLPPRPNEMTAEREAELLDRQFKRLNEDPTTDSEDSTSSRSSSPTRSSPPSEGPELEGPLAVAAAISDDLLRTLHGNLETRLLPFWSSVLPGRTVHVKLYSKKPHDSTHSGQAITSTYVQTNADGSFQTVFSLGWEDVLEVAFGGESEEPEFHITAELHPAKPQPSRPSTPTHMSTEMTSMRSTPNATLPPTASASTRVPLTNASVRVISDIDDTVKHSDIPGGARSVFRNVFVNELNDLVIPGMGEWFTGMWKKGVRFHYVSNGPFELLPILGDFFKIANLPPGSIKLRSYAGRSLFSGLLTAPAARKRAGVQEIISSFPHSYFILVGDSGEQDLELYTELARESPHQILGIFIRDTGAGDALDDPTGFRVTTAYNNEIQTPFDAPSVDLPNPTSQLSASGDRRPPPIDTQSIQTSWSASNKTPTTISSSASTKSSHYFRSTRYTAEPEGADETPGAPPTAPYATYTRKTPTTPRGSTSSSASYFSRTTPKSSASTSTNTSSRIPEGERKRHELQMRVYRARTVLPEHIVLRIFRSPSECVEADALLASA